MRYLILFLGMLWLASNAQAADKQIRDLHFHVSASAPEWILRLYTKAGRQGTEFETILYAAEIIDAGTGNLIQALELPKSGNSGNVSMLPFNGATADSTFKDVNFDGYQDIILHSGSYASGNYSDSFWIYNSAYKKFVYNSDLSSLTNVVINSKEKLVYASNACCGGLKVSETYQWQEGQLTLLEEMSMQAMDPQPKLAAPENCPNATWFVQTIKKETGEVIKSDPFPMCG